jgi:hypothetical protein
MAEKKNEPLHPIVARILDEIVKLGGDDPTPAQFDAWQRTITKTSERQVISLQVIAAALRFYDAGGMDEAGALIALASRCVPKREIDARTNDDLRNRAARIVNAANKSKTTGLSAPSSGVSMNKRAAKKKA